jgi:hypothetical protein
MKVKIALCVFGFWMTAMQAVAVEQGYNQPGDLHISGDSLGIFVTGANREKEKSQPETALKASETATLFMQNSPAANGSSAFDQVSFKARIGDSVIVTDSSGREQKGKVLDFSPKSLSLAIHGKRRELPASDIRALDLQNRDSLKNGALIGFGIGMGVATVGVIAVAANSHSGEDIAIMAVGGTLIYGGIGAALGLLVDALVEERLPIYRAVATKPAATKLSLSPLITRDKKGIALTLRFAP